jgi:hypothetical protein
MNLLKVIVDRSKWNGNTLKPVEESRLYDPNTNKEPSAAVAMSMTTSHS